jgi:methyl-accepting chemotaxis protein
MVSDIASAAQGQAASLAEINVAITQMDKSTQQNAAMVEETTAACHSLGDETESLLTRVQEFTVSQQRGQVDALRRKGQAMSSAIRDTRPAPAPSRRTARKAASGGSNDWEEF